MNRRCEKWLLDRLDRCFRHLHSPNRDQFATFHCEPLESRQLLAGVVKVDVTPNNDVIISGDEFDNAVEITVSASPNGGIVKGFLGDTEIQIDVNGDLTSIRSIRIDLGSGSDSIRLFTTTSDDIDIDLREQGALHVDTIGLSGQTGDVRLRGGAGRAELNMENLDVHRNVRMSSTSGENHLTIRDSTINGDLRLRFGDATDRVDFNDAIVGNLDIRFGDSQGGSAQIMEMIDTSVSRVRVRGGNDRDIIALGSSTVTGAIRANLGDGDDIMEWAASEQTAGSMTLRMGDGNDLVVDGGFCVIEPFGQSSFAEAVNIDLGGGTNQVRIGQVSVGIQFDGQLSISSRSGDDLILVAGQSEGDEVAALQARLRGGDDRIALSNLTIRGSSRVETGSGADDVELLNAIPLDGMRIRTG